MQDCAALPQTPWLAQRIPCLMKAAERSRRARMVALKPIIPSATSTETLLHMLSCVLSTALFFMNLSKPFNHDFIGLLSLDLFILHILGLEFSLHFFFHSFFLYDQTKSPQCTSFVLVILNFCIQSTFIHQPFSLDLFS